MLVKLSTSKNIEIRGVMRTFQSGECVNVGKQLAKQWIAANEARTVTPQRVPSVPKLFTSGRLDWGFTMCAVPRAFEGVIGIRQENAIRSWQCLEPLPEIVLIGDDPGVAKAARGFKCRYEPDVDRNEFGTPLISSIFWIAQSRATHDLVCYVNCDIMLVGIADAIRVCADVFEQFLMIGRRWDIDVYQRWKFALGWQVHLRRFVQGKGNLQGVDAIDYFAFRRGLYRKVPGFAIGRSAWDNWLVSCAIQRDIPVVDASQVVLSVHQDTAHPTHMTAERALERKRNRAFYDRDCKRVKGTMRNANWTLTKDGLVRR